MIGWADETFITVVSDTKEELLSIIKLGTQLVLAFSAVKLLERVFCVRDGAIPAVQEYPVVPVKPYINLLTAGTAGSIGEWY